jgi:cytochrome b561
MSEVTTARRVMPQADAGQFDAVSIGLHWLTVVLVAGQFLTARLFDLATAEHALLLTVHRSAGLVTLAVIITRFAWRHSFAHLPPFPARMPKLQQRLATFNEYGLYACMLLQPLTGLGGTLARGRPFMLFAWRAPALWPANKQVQQVLHALHEGGAQALVALIGVHIAAALLHAFVLRDGVFQRMWPVRR